MSQINIYQSGGPAEIQPPALRLKTNRGLFKMILLGILTLGIYPLVVLSSVSTDINLIASGHDGRKTMHFCLLLFIFLPLTLSIAGLVWNHRICDRIGTELNRRGLLYRFNSVTYWLWGFLGTLILIGPLIYTHKLLKAMNILCADYNRRG